MFCSKCGKELDSNNNCNNPECPSNINMNFNPNIEQSILDKNTFNTTSENTQSNKGQAFTNNHKQFSENTDHYNQQSSFSEENSNFNNMNNNQRQNYNFNNQNSGFNGQYQNCNSNQYNQNNNFNNGFNQNYGYNQNASYGFNTNPNFRDQNGISRQEMFEFIGEKSPEYYLRRWEESQFNSNFIHWNWAAFFFNSFWFFYRKAYSVGAIILAINLVSTFLFRHLVGLRLLIKFSTMLFSALWGNQIYIKHCVEKIKSIKFITQNQNPAFLQQRLRSAGGITWIPVFILMGIYIFVLLLIYIAYLHEISQYYYSPYNSYYW